jgi:peroxiredoxin
MKKLWMSLLLASVLAQGQAMAAQTLAGHDVVNGKSVNLSQYKNQTVLLVFFSTGCNTCVYNFKLIREFYKANKASHFGVIGVGLDKKPSQFHSYAQLVNATTPKNEQFPLTWRLDPAHQDSFGEMKNDSTVFVIGKNGEISLKREGVIKDDDWDEIWTSLQVQ